MNMALKMSLNVSYVRVAATVKKKVRGGNSYDLRCMCVCSCVLEAQNTHYHTSILLSKVRFRTEHNVNLQKKHHCDRAVYLRFIYP